MEGPGCKGGLAAVAGSREEARVTGLEDQWWDEQRGKEAVDGFGEMVEALWDTAGRNERIVNGRPLALPGSRNLAFPLQLADSDCIWLQQAMFGSHVGTQFWGTERHNSEAELAAFDVET